MRRQKSYTVGYRINAKHLSLLEKRAERSGNVSVHEEARRILIERLEDTSLDALAQNLDHLHERMGGISDEVQSLRDDVKQALAWIVRRLNEISEENVEEDET